MCVWGGFDVGSHFRLFMPASLDILNFIFIKFIARYDIYFFSFLSYNISDPSSLGPLSAIDASGKSVVKGT